MRVITNKELNEQEARDKELEGEIKKGKLDVASVVDYIDSCWDEAKRAKESNAEIQILKNMRQIDGEYEKQKLDDIRSMGGSEIFMMITDAKAKNAAYWVSDILFQPNSKPWGLAPTPIPELPTEVTQDIYQTLFDEMSGVLSESILATGQAPDMEAMTDVMNKLAEKVEAEAKEIIIRRAKGLGEKVEMVVDDYLTEGGWYEALRKVIPNIILHTGFLKGPIHKKRNVIKVSPDPTTGMLVKTSETEIIPTYESRHPIFIYPAPGSKDIDDGYLFDRMNLSPIALQNLIGVKGYDEKEIRAVLGEIRDGALKIQWLSVDQEVADIMDDVSPLFYDSDKIDCLEFWGAVNGKSLKEWGIKKDNNDNAIDDDFLYNIRAYKIGNHVIGIFFNVDPMGRKPYYKSSFEERDGSFWGKGLPEVIVDAQSVCNAAARAIINNIGMGSGPQVQRNIDRIPAALRDDNILTPWKVWDVTDSMMSSGKALEFYQPPMVIERLMSAYNQFSKIADEHSGIPAYAHGDAQVGGAGNTASGLSMLMGAAARGIRGLIANIDLNIIGPSVERQYHWVVENEEHYGLICDYSIVTTGSSAALAKEQLAARRVEFMNATANPVDMQILGAEGRKYLLEETAKSIQLDLARVFPPQAKPEQQAMPGGPPGATPGPNAQNLDASGAPVVGQDTRQFNIPQGG